MVVPKQGRAFREFVIEYHEIGDENYLVQDRNGKYLPLVDPTSEHTDRADGPSTTAVNRS